MKFLVTFLSQKDHYIIWHLQLFSTVQCLHYCSTAWVNRLAVGPTEYIFLLKHEMKQAVVGKMATFDL